MPRRCSVALFTLCLAVVLTLTSLFAPVVSAEQRGLTPVEQRYFAVLASYEQGHFEKAVVELLAWPEDDLRLMRRCLVEMPVVDGTALPDQINARSKAAAVMMHTEAAVSALLADAVGPANLHLDVAQLLLTTGRGSHKQLSVFSDDVDTRGGELVAGFSRAWLPAVTRQLTRVLAYDAGRKLLQAVTRSDDYMAFLVRTREPDLMVAAGMLEEGAAFIRSRERELTEIKKEPVSVESSRRWAEAAFRRALELDPTDSYVRVRLGHLLLEAGRVEEAATELRRVGGDATARSRYLAALFAAEAAERQGDATAAAARYQEALTILPGSQAARVGFAALLESRGELAQAAETLRPLARRRRQPDAQADPWTTYPRGDFQRGSEAMVRLRAMVVTK